MNNNNETHNTMTRDEALLRLRASADALSLSGERNHIPEELIEPWYELHRLMPGAEITEVKTNREINEALNLHPSTPILSINRQGITQLLACPGYEYNDEYNLGPSYEAAKVIMIENPEQSVVLRLNEQTIEEINVERPNPLLEHMLDSTGAKPINVDVSVTLSQVRCLDEVIEQMQSVLDTLRESRVSGSFEINGEVPQELSDHLERWGIHLELSKYQT